jgi:DNA-binding transcriptional LysR family regulator
MELEEIDLNLLVVFRHLLEERSVSKVADRLDLSQPAVSNALRRLRKLLGDELFLRTPGGMVPTPFAEQLAESISYGLGMIHGALNLRASFDPKTDRRSFAVGMTDIGEIYLLPPLMELLRKKAPGVTLSTCQSSTGNLREDMETGKLDLALGFFEGLTAGFFHRRLFEERYVCMFRKDHPLAKKKLTLRDFSAADHLLVASPGTGHGQIDDILKRSGVERRIVLTVPHFVAVGHILQATDLLATVPSSLAERMLDPFKLVAVPHPATLPAVAINASWHAKVHRDPANQWLRGLIAEHFGR